jgi:hypothetical protein
MSVEYNFYIGVGCVVKHEDLVKPYSRRVKEKYHMEDRFCPNTGKKLKKVKIIDIPAYDELWYNGEPLKINGNGSVVYRDEVVGDFESTALSEIIAKDIGCFVIEHGDYYASKNHYLFTPLETNIEWHDISHNISMSGGLALDDVAACKQKCKKIFTQLKKKGLNPQEPRVVHMVDIS